MKYHRVKADDVERRRGGYGGKSEKTTVIGRVRAVVVGVVKAIIMILITMLLIFVMMMMKGK